ncbi:MAG: hypothetical protein M3350_07765 [Actinomycetota bacterium]|nr:hypothetical protein [Actinomycetota bacterium]
MRSPPNGGLLPVRGTPGGRSHGKLYAYVKATRKCAKAYSRVVRAQPAE